MATATEWIDTVIERAGALRKAGVSTISIDGCSVTLAPLAADEGPTGPSVAQDSDDPLFNPATYPNGIVPGFTREEDRR